MFTCAICHEDFEDSEIRSLNCCGRVPLCSKCPDEVILRFRMCPYRCGHIPTSSCNYGRIERENFYSIVEEIIRTREFKNSYSKTICEHILTYMDFHQLKEMNDTFHLKNVNELEGCEIFTF